MGDPWRWKWGLSPAPIDFAHSLPLSIRESQGNTSCGLASYLFILKLSATINLSRLYKGPRSMRARVIKYKKLGLPLVLKSSPNLVKSYTPPKETILAMKLTHCFSVLISTVAVKAWSFDYYCPDNLAHPIHDSGGSRRSCTNFYTPCKSGDTVSRDYCVLTTA